MMAANVQTEGVQRRAEGRPAGDVVSDWWRRSGGSGSESVLRDFLWNISLAGDVTDAAKLEGQYRSLVDLNRARRAKSSDREGLVGICLLCRWYYNGVENSNTGGGGSGQRSDRDCVPCCGPECRSVYRNLVADLQKFSSSLGEEETVDCVGTVVVDVAGDRSYYYLPSKQYVWWGKYRRGRFVLRPEANRLGRTRVGCQRHVCYLHKGPENDGASTASTASPASSATPTIPSAIDQSFASNTKNLIITAGGLEAEFWPFRDFAEIGRQGLNLQIIRNDITHRRRVGQPADIASSEAYGSLVTAAITKWKKPLQKCISLWMALFKSTVRNALEDSMATLPKRMIFKAADTQLMVLEERDKEHEKIRNGLSKLKPKEFATEIEVAAMVRGYYILAAIRFVGSVTLSLNFELFRWVTSNRSHKQLTANLGLDQADDTTFARLMEEDVEISNKRERLKGSSRTRFSALMTWTWYHAGESQHQM
ncbi:hypothetical protein JX266_014096 [Neoarthrinium moseri]|nr:hypothetical protein JX266_014096 [Neoarthrinium moseri]